jgi:hypothetical protein
MTELQPLDNVVVTRVERGLNSAVSRCGKEASP